MNTKKVSVIIPTYKRPIYLSRAIDSVLNSTWKNIEIIVVDDNNEGDEYRIETERLMKKYLLKYDNIIYEKHSCNKNGSAARNTGIRRSSGEYIMFLDDDDEFLPKKIETQVHYMETHDFEWGACYTRYLDIKNGKIYAQSAECQEGNLLVNELARNLFVHAGSNLMVRRDVVLEIGGFDEAFLRNQDVEFLVRILKKYKLGFVDELGLKVHLHSRVYKIDYFTLTQQYIERFEKEINSLSEVDKKAVYRMIGLQKIRYAIQKRKIDMMFGFMKENNISFLRLIHYLFHLIWRLVRHKSYSYPMKYLY